MSCVALPKISIITPSLNQGRYLEKNICSVRDQSYRNIEHIIIDGGSTDESKSIISKYESHLQYWVSEPDSGQSQAINKGFLKSSGEWLTWLNADDYYLPDAIECFVRCILENPQADWVVGNTIVVGENCSFMGRYIPRYQPDSPWYSYVAMRVGDTSLPQPSSFFSRKAWMTTGDLDESLRYAMDFDYWGRLAFAGYRPVRIDHDLAAFRMHVESKTSEGLLPFWREEIRVVDKWLERCNVDDKNVLMDCRKFLVFGCIKLKLINFLSRIFGARLIDVLVDRLYKLKGGKHAWSLETNKAEHHD
jgi:glycosyltransferase involved in cell wall biosynthesis